MKIVVFLKQVPDNTKLKLDAIGDKLPREGVEMMINPYDEYALETALRIKEAAGGESTVTCISLGAASAKDIVKKAIAAGCDDAFLLSNDAFKDGDSTAIARALAAAAKTHVPDASVLLFGQMSLDDANAQTGPKVAEILDLPSITACKNYEFVSDATLKLTRETERGLEVHELTLPGVICMMKCDYELRTANIKGVMKANKATIPVEGPAEIGVEPALVGAAGSTSSTAKVWPRPPKAAGTKIEGADPKAAADQLVAFLKQKTVL